MPDLGQSVANDCTCPICRNPYVGGDQYRELGLSERSPHYYIEVESASDTTSLVYDLHDPTEPVVFGPSTYEEARKWCIEHGDPEAAE